MSSPLCLRLSVTMRLALVTISPVDQAGVGRALGGGITPKSPPVSANVFDALTRA
ncbi:hypothetical protein [Enterobacter phage 01_vB_Eclo_IJM]|nr:hypothetical protein [Enterobacter phage 01_vB_Eclo_IJM]